jgi:hypothetical protein
MLAVGWGLIQRVGRKQPPAANREVPPACIACIAQSLIFHPACLQPDRKDDVVIVLRLRLV